jgi:hypothetical protein
MKLVKDNQSKILNAPKAIARWKGFGWKEESEVSNFDETETVTFENQPKRRGRPPKKEE